MIAVPSTSASRFAACALLLASFSFAQTKKPPAPQQAQSASTVSYSAKDDREVIEIRNVAYDLKGSRVPGRPPDEHLVLRRTTYTKQVLGDMGMEAATTLEAWPLGMDFKQKPLYSIKVSGVDSKTIDDSLIEVSRGLEEVQWWSLYKLGNGEHFFDTYVPLVKFSLSREIQTMRYAGLDVPPDDTGDKRLGDPHVVAVLTYASEDHILREALFTCDDPKRARLLRSYADEERSLTVVEGPSTSSNGKRPGDPSLTLKFSISQSYPSAPQTISILIPVLAGDLDLAHVQLPAGLHVAAWKR